MQPPNGGRGFPQRRTGEGNVLPLREVHQRGEVLDYWWNCEGQEGRKMRIGTGGRSSGSRRWIEEVGTWEVGGKEMLGKESEETLLQRSSL